MTFLFHHIHTIITLLEAQCIFTCSTHHDTFRVWMQICGWRSRLHVSFISMCTCMYVCKLSDMLKHHVLLMGLSSVHAMLVWLIRMFVRGFLCIHVQVFVWCVAFNWNIHQCTFVCLCVLFLIGISSGVCGSWVTNWESRGEGGDPSERNKQVMMWLADGALMRRALPRA